MTREEPETGKWIYFERTLKEDLLDAWGEIPPFKRVGIYLEVRYDSVPVDVVQAEVYWDDIFVG